MKNFDNVWALAHGATRFLLPGVSALAFAMAQPAQAALISNSEIHVSNIQVTAPGASLSWSYAPGLNVASASAFDDPSGSVNSYNDDPSATGQASASVTAAYSSAAAFASSDQNKIDVASAVNNPSITFTPVSNSAYGEIYNVFQISGSNPVPVTFSLDWNASLSGVSATNDNALAYALQLAVSDGINNYSREAHDVVGVKGSVNISPSGILNFTQTLQPNTYYSLDVIAQLTLGQYIPEPSSISLFLGAAAFARRFSRAKLNSP